MTTSHCTTCGVRLKAKDDLLCPDCFSSKLAWRAMRPDSPGPTPTEPCSVCGHTEWATNRYADLWCGYCWCGSVDTKEA